MTPSDRQLTGLAGELGEALRSTGATVASVESCTGGWIARSLTDVPGSSEWFGWGWVTYSNEAKRELVGVPGEVLEAHGAVSAETVLAMARAGRRQSGAEYAMAVSGIAGPDGGTPDKPVGTVWFAWDGPGVESGPDAPGIAERQRFAGDREAIRRQAVAHALQGLLDLVSSGPGKRSVP